MKDELNNLAKQYGVSREVVASIILPSVGSLFIHEGRVYKVVHRNVGQYRFSAEPYQKGDTLTWRIKFLIILKILWIRLLRKRTK